MSTVKSKKVQIGYDSTSTNNFTLYQPSTPDGTLRIGVGNADSPTEVGRFNSNGYVATNAPAFSAYSTVGISITKDTWTKLPLNATQFDTTGDYNTSTYRFTPSVAGYYHLISNVHSQTAIDASPYYYYTRFDKNGSVYLYTSSFHTASSIFAIDNTLNSSALVYLNGTTDYVELYAYQSSASSTISMNGGVDRNTFSGFLVRAT